MELVLPPLRHSKFTRLKRERPSEDEKRLRKVAKGYVKQIAISIKEKRVRSLSGGLSAGVSDGHQKTGCGGYRALPTRSDW